MRPPRFSIAGLLVLIGVAALGMAAIRYASKEWEGVAALATLLLLATATLGAWTGRRASWAGFAAFGWSYVIFVGGWALFEAVTQSSGMVVGGIPAVPLTPLAGPLDGLYPHLFHAPPAGMIGSQRVPAVRSGFDYAYFQRVGHIVAGLLFGLVGALIAAVIDPRRTTAEPRGPQ